MATYVLVTQLSSELTRNIRNREELGREWRQRIAHQVPAVRFVAHYALLGPWDFLDIYEAPGEEDAAKVSMISLSLGAARAESWTALPYARFLELTKEI